MRQILLLALLISVSFVSAKEVKSEWNATALTDDTIKKIQSAQVEYKQCVATEMQKPGYAKIESRSSTDAIIKQCEKVLSKMRQVYIEVKVPVVIADRHLKKMRTDITRRVLKQLMFAEASRKAGQ
jgi:hypothetical protein